MKRSKNLVKKISPSSGFTLLELTISTIITVSVTIMALNILGNTQQGFSQDTKKIDQTQKNASILDIVGKDILETGEQIEDARFPAVKVKPQSYGSSLVLYRGVAKPLAICNSATLTGSVNKLPVTSTDATVTNLKGNCALPTTALETGTKYPRSMQDWYEKRTSPRAFSRGVIYDGKGVGGAKLDGIQEFTYLGEDPTAALSPASPYTAPLPTFNLDVGSFTPSFALAPNLPLPIYLVEKKEYLVCSNTLMMRLNSTVEGQCPSGVDPSFQTIANNISRLDIQVSMRNLQNPLDPESPEESPTLISNPTFPVVSDPPATTDLYWHNIQFINVKITSIPPASELPAAASQKLYESESSFYPRNIMSSRPFKDVK
jgi:hypothetical protein